jgi:hypothetical protein
VFLLACVLHRRSAGIDGSTAIPSLRDCLRLCTPAFSGRNRSAWDPLNSILDAVNPRTKEEIFPGYALRSELGWSEFVGRMMPESMGGGQYLRYALFQDANWDYMTFDFDSQMARADRLDGGG